MQNEMNNETIIDEDVALKELKSNYKKAEKIINKPDKLEELLKKAEKKLKSIPKVGDKLSHIPVFISMINSYIRKDYTELPMGTIIAIISALIYFIAPVDLIPDVIPGVGHIDDAAVIVACLKLVDDDVKEYMEWRKNK